MNPRAIYSSSLALLTVVFVTALVAIASFAQKGGKGRYIHIPLTKDARQNGYKIYQRGRDEINFTATGVVDPDTGDKLRGPRKLEYKCGDQIYAKDLMFYSASPPKKIECANPMDPIVAFFAETRFITLTAGAYGYRSNSAPSP